MLIGKSLRSLVCCDDAEYSIRSWVDVVENEMFQKVAQLEAGWEVRKSLLEFALNDRDSCPLKTWKGGMEAFELRVTRIVRLPSHDRASHRVEPLNVI